MEYNQFWYKLLSSVGRAALQIALMYVIFKSSIPHPKKVKNFPLIIQKLHPWQYNVLIWIIIRQIERDFPFIYAIWAYQNSTTI